MATVDLDAILAASRETEDTEHVIVFRGEDFTVPVEAPFGFMEACMAGKNNQEIAFLAIPRLFTDDEYKRFIGFRPSIDEATAFVVEAAKLWGVDTGESQASGGSSSATTKPSRQTSNGSTRSTSGKRSGAKKPSGSDA